MLGDKEKLANTRVWLRYFRHKANLFYNSSDKIEPDRKFHRMSTEHFKYFSVTPFRVAGDKEGEVNSDSGEPLYSSSSGSSDNEDDGNDGD